MSSPVALNSPPQFLSLSLIIFGLFVSLPLSQFAFEYLFTLSSQTHDSSPSALRHVLRLTLRPTALSFPISEPIRVPSLIAVTLLTDSDHLNHSEERQHLVHSPFMSSSLSWRGIWFLGLKWCQNTFKI